MIEPFGLILAGGRGTRMGGVAKAGLELGGRRLLAHCVDRLEPQVRSLAVNTNEPLETDLPQLADTIAGHPGPLAGILSGLIWAKSQGGEHIVSVAVDTPFFPCDLVPHLLMAAETSETGLAIAATPDGQHGTFGLWPVSVIEPLQRFIASGGRKVRDFTNKSGAALVNFPETTPPAFFNINTPHDLEQARAWL